MSITPATTEVQTVSALVQAIQAQLEECFSQVNVTGEISGFSQAASGHWYFDLKDADATLRCAMFRGDNQKADFTPEDGNMVVLTGNVGVYAQRGSMQLIVRTIAPAGEGLLRMQFEKLKQQLQKEGLFELERKRKLPPLPQHILIITSPHGAALHDMLTVLRRRYPATLVTVIPSLVQGQQASIDLCNALTLAERASQELHPRPELLVVTRGGGSLEDLQAFNDEKVARALAKSSLPTVSAVGHETDFTIADFVADKRCPTPSACAEEIVPDSLELSQQLMLSYKRLVSQMTGYLKTASVYQQSLQQRLRSPTQQLEQRMQQLDYLQETLTRLQSNALYKATKQIKHLIDTLARFTPLATIQQQDAYQQLVRQRLTNTINHQLKHFQQRFSEYQRLLEANNPKGILQRGYAILSDSEGNIVRDVVQVDEGDRVQAMLYQGSLHCKVTQIKPPQAQTTKTNDDTEQYNLFGE